MSLTVDSVSSMPPFGVGGYGERILKFASRLYRVGCRVRRDNAFHRSCPRRHGSADRGDRAPDQKLDGRTEAAEERARRSKAAASAIAKRGAALEGGGSPGARGGRPGAARRNQGRDRRITSNASGLTGASGPGGYTTASFYRGQGH